MIESLRLRVVQANSDNSIPFDLGAKLEYFPELNTPTQQKIIVDRTTKDLIDPNSRNRLVSQLMLYTKRIGVTSVEGERIKSLLPIMNIKGSELQSVAAVFPEFSKARKEEITSRVILNFKNGDRLDLEDMQNVLLEKIRGVEWIKAATGEETLLSIEKLRYTERVIPEKAETITYAQYQVDLGTALLMPNNASYLYEVVSGGSEIDFAYVVTAIYKDKKIFDELVRGTVGGQASRCQNLRVKNIFGGVTSINSMANNDMKARCFAATAMPIDELRKEILKKVASTVLTVPTINAAHTAN